MQIAADAPYWKVDCRSDYQEQLDTISSVGIRINEACVLESGGLATSGVNFGLKLRRNSTDLEDFASTWGMVPLPRL